MTGKVRVKDLKVPGRPREVAPDRLRRPLRFTALVVAMIGAFAFDEVIGLVWPNGWLASVGQMPRLVIGFVLSLLAEALIERMVLSRGQALAKKKTGYL